MKIRQTSSIAWNVGHRFFIGVKEALNLGILVGRMPSVRTPLEAPNSPLPRQLMWKNEREQN